MQKGDYNPNLNGGIVDKGGEKMVLGGQKKNYLRNSKRRWRGSPPE